MKSALRPNVILEDVDVLESRQAGGAKRGSRSAEARQLSRRLLVFALPYKWSLAGAFVLAMFGATARVGWVFILERVMEPLFNRAGAPSSLAKVFVLVPSLESAKDAVLWPVLFVGQLVRVSWMSMPARDQLAGATVALVLLVLLEQTNKYVQRLTMRTVSLEIVRNIRARLFHRLMGLSMRFFQANHSGKLLSRITHDLNSLGMLLVDVMVSAFTDLFALVGALLYLWYRTGSYVVLGMCLAVLCFYPVQRLAARIRRKELQNRRTMGSIFVTLTESLSAQKIVKAFRAEDHERERFDRINEAYTEGRKRAAELKARTEPIVEITGAVVISTLLWFGGSQVIDGSWRGENFTAIIFLLVQVVASLRRLADTNTKLQAGMASADRVATVLHSKAEIIDAPDAIVLDGIHQGLRFVNVRYAHDPAQLVLKDISFDLPVGKTVAIVGPTGAGKSTIGDLVPRFFDVDSGSVEIDGHDVRRIAIESLRDHVALVTQDTVLFHDTVAANIAYGSPDTPRDVIERAARSAHAHEFIERLPDGYDTVVGERGMSLSGGERQRIAIARALVKDSPLMILDEATSALDSQSEALVQDAVQTLRQGRTMIIIAHRLSTVRDADTILVLEEGRIVERGTHDDLLGQDGLYASLCRLQGHH